MNCITDFLPDDTSEHNTDGENMDEIVFGGKPAALKQVTWDNLDVFEQYALELISRGETLLTPNYRTTYDRLLGMELVELIPAELTTFPYAGKELRITPAGRALLPAPETLTPSELDAAIYGTPGYWEAMSNASVEAHAVTLERVKALEDENARLRAALENIAHCPVSSGEYGYMVMLYEARRALGIPTPYDNLTDDDIGEDGL